MPVPDVWPQVRLDPATISGNAGEVLRQAARFAAERKINITFRIDANKLHVTVDPDNLPSALADVVPAGSCQVGRSSSEFDGSTLSCGRSDRSNLLRAGAYGHRDLITHSRRL